MCVLFQRKWLNAYHQQVLSEVGEKVLKKNGKTAAYEWVVARTHPIPDDPVYPSDAVTHICHTNFLAFIALISLGIIYMQ